MAVGTGYSKVATNGLVFAYDTGDTYNSYLGRPTSNILTNTPLYIYNNVPGSVSSTLTQTSETYRGAAVWTQTLTALDGNGAYYLSNGNNPGIGVYTGGGGGNANQYSGHTIFFKPTVPMNGTPIFTCYSNIGGWQSCGNVEDMGDGWFRAYVLWYNTITQGDGKYWAINPLSTSIGQTVTIYWAGPFREDLNSTSISQFVNGTRSSTQSVIDIAAGRTITVNNNPFTNPAINPQLNFDGSDDYLSVNSFTPSPVGLTMSVVARINSASSSWVRFFDFGNGSNSENLLFCRYGSSNNLFFGVYNGTPANVQYTVGGTLQFDQLAMYTATADGTNFRIYINGTLVHTEANPTVPTSTTRTSNYLGRSNWPDPYLNGQIPVAQIYNRALSLSEIRDNYFHYKTRFNLP